MELETQRLRLLPLKLADAATTQRLFPHWEIVRLLSKQVPWPFPPDGAHTYYRDVALPEMAAGRAWHWGIWLKDGPDHLVGSVALFRNERENRGFWIGQQWQRQGFMGEAVEAVTSYWFDVLEFSVLRVMKAVENEPSRRISLRSGMRVVDLVEHEYVAGCLKSEVWEITAEEWHNRF